MIGICPNCKERARGDQCDTCGTVLEPELLHEQTCSICGTAPIYRETKHLYIAISKLESELKAFVNSQTGWRKNAVSFTNKYIEEGLRDRALTRDLNWGIGVPKSGYDGKKIYIWAENVLGYLSMSSIAAKERNVPFATLWGEKAIHYYIHAKDNIPFHTIILPSLIWAHREGYHLPDYIISNEYLTLEGRKISTSQNWAIWVKDIIESYDPDSLRYFLIANGPEKRDTDFSWHEYVNCHNGELLGCYGNFINRTVMFLQKYFNNAIPCGSIEHDIDSRISNAYVSVGKKIEEGKLKDALEEIFEFVRFGNKYFDTEAPWLTRTTDIDKCKSSIFNCAQLIVNYAILLAPFLPFSSDRVIKWFGVSTDWKKQYTPTGYVIPETNILFERLDKNIVEDETNKLHDKAK